MRRITANLAPADLRKAGPAYDLPIAVAILLSSGQVAEIPDSSLFLEELSLDGALRHTNGILPMVVVARDEGFKKAFVPSPDAREAALVDGIEIIPVTTLSELAAHLRGETEIANAQPGEGDGEEQRHAGKGRAVSVAGGVDLADIRGQEHTTS